MPTNEMGGQPSPCPQCPMHHAMLEGARLAEAASTRARLKPGSEYTRTHSLGPSVFCVIRDSLGLDPKYVPHRNVDAVRLAKLMSKLIKMKLCKRALSAAGKLCWCFLDDAAYATALETLGKEGCAFNQ